MSKNLYVASHSRYCQMPWESEVSRFGEGAEIYRLKTFLDLAITFTLNNFLDLTNYTLTFTPNTFADLTIISTLEN